MRPTQRCSNRGQGCSPICGFGHGTSTELSAEQALAAGREAQPQPPADAAVDARLGAGSAAGDAVSVAPIDYGQIHVAGRLVSWNRHEIVIEREDDQARGVMVHFPNIGFEVANA